MGSRAGDTKSQMRRPPSSNPVREPLPAGEQVLCHFCLSAFPADRLDSHMRLTHGSQHGIEADPLGGETAGRSPELLQAAALLAAGHDEDAMLALETLVEREPQSVEGWYQKGMHHCGRSEYSDALLCFERGIAIHEADARLWVAKFYALEKVGSRSAEAARCLVRAANLDPLFTQRWIAQRFTEEELRRIRDRYGGGQ